MPEKGAWTVCRFKGGLGKKQGGGVFEEGLIPYVHYGDVTLSQLLKVPPRKLEP